MAPSAPKGVRAPILSYAIPPRREFIVERGKQQLSIRIPPLRSWRKLHPAHALGFLPLLNYAPFVCVALSKGHGLAELGVPICIALGVPLAVLLHALDRLTTRTVIEVTRDSLAITLHNAFVGAKTAVWSLVSIHEIKLNPNNGKLLIRAWGREMAEFYLAPDLEQRGEIVDAIREAAFHGTFDSIIHKSKHAKPRRFAVGTPLLVTSLIINLGGFAVIFIPGMDRIAVLIMGFSLFLAMVTAGITFGTQKKDFFT